MINKKVIESNTFRFIRFDNLSGFIAFDKNGESIGFDEVVGNIRYRDDLTNMFGEEESKEMELMYSSDISDCYVAHCTNGKPVVKGPFRSFIHGYLARNNMLSEVFEVK